WASTWLETVQRSSDRIRALTDKNPDPVVHTIITAPDANGRVDLGRALELLAQERFAEALQVIPQTTSAKDADAALLRAALLTHCGRLEESELACAELLAFD